LSPQDFAPLLEVVRAIAGTDARNVADEFGAVRLAEITTPDLQDFVERLIAQGLAPTTIQVALLPLRAIFKRAISRGELIVNPCTGLQLPAIKTRRERFASPAEAEALITAAPEGERRYGRPPSTPACAVAS
jgi:site-specific recombinase XerD